MGEAKRKHQRHVCNFYKSHGKALEVVTVRQMDVFEHLRRARNGDYRSYVIMRSIASGLARVADPTKETALCACCDYEFRRDEQPPVFMLQVPVRLDDQVPMVMASAVCPSCARLPHGEMRARFIKQLNADLDLDAREICMPVEPGRA